MQNLIRFFDSNTTAPVPWSVPLMCGHFLLAYLIIPWCGVSLLSLFLPHTLPMSLVAYGFSVITWAGIFIFLCKRYGQPARQALGFTVDIQNIMRGGALSALGILLIGASLGALAQYFHWAYTDPLKGLSPQVSWWLRILALLIAPLVEECVFRGYLQGTLQGKMPGWAAVLLTTALFTAFHGLYYGNTLALVYVGLVGLLLGLVRLYTKSVVPGVLGHGLNNILAVLIR